LPVDRGYEGRICQKDLGHWRVRLSREQTQRLLQEVPRAYHTEINDLLLSALGKTLSAWSGRGEVVIGLEGHGRQDIGGGEDTSRTVGWFTSLYPVLLELPQQEDQGLLIREVKEQLRKVPDKGLGYGVLRSINRLAGLQGASPWEIVFNYLGQLDNVVTGSVWFSGAVERMGESIGADQEVQEKLSVNGKVQG
ncbi:condensation domain-containing protein, partial [Flavitalea flava]